MDEQIYSDADPDELALNIDAALGLMQFRITEQSAQWDALSGKGLNVSGFALVVPSLFLAAATASGTFSGLQWVLSGAVALATVVTLVLVWPLVTTGTFHGPPTTSAILKDVRVARARESWLDSLDQTECRNTPQLERRARLLEMAVYALTVETVLTMASMASILLQRG